MTAPPAPPAKRREWANRTLLLAASLILGAALSEGVLRLHQALTRPGQLRDLEENRPHPAPGQRVSLGDLVEPVANPDVVYRLRPNLDVRFTEVAVRTNARGWRDDEIPFEKPPGTIRIVGLGDSVMFGWAVEKSERYTDRLQALLNARYPGSTWQVLSLAAPGYNLVMETEVFAREGLSYAPDLVLYGYVANDTCLPNFVAAGFDLWGPRLLLAERLRRLGRSGATRISPLVDRADAVTPARRGVSFERRYCTPAAVAPSSRHLVGERHFADALRRLHGLADRRGAPVVLLSHPLDGDVDLPSVPAGVDVVHGLIEPGMASPTEFTGELRVSDVDPHPSALGHGWIARTVFETLERRGLWRRLQGRARGG
ncbi:MAG: SGNH/GDSL hydrolase family protein [Acidobacteriota bacterium]